MYSWEQTTSCKQLFGDGYRVAFKSLHQLVMDGSRSTATYPSKGWIANLPLQFFLSFSPVFVWDHANYPPVPILSKGHRRRRHVNYSFIFYLRISQLYSCSVHLSVSELTEAKCVTPALNSKLNMRKVSRCRSRSPKYAELSHFTLLFFRERLEMYKDL